MKAGTLRRIAAGLGIDHFGVADLSRAREAIREQGGEAISRYRFAVSLGIPLPDAVVDLLPDRAQRAVRMSYRHHAYDLINLRLDQAASRIAGHLQAKGWEAFPVSASRTVDDERLCGAISHKLAARLAGLGWVGKSCLLVTPSNGPRVRWATVLTNASLPATGPILEDGCGECRQCVDICPVKAFTGRHFEESEPRERRYDAHKCEKYVNSLKDGDGMGVCGMCLYVCPIRSRGRRGAPALKAPGRDATSRGTSS